MNIMLHATRIRYLITGSLAAALLCSGCCPKQTCPTTPVVRSTTGTPGTSATPATPKKVVFDFKEDNIEGAVPKPSLPPGVKQGATAEAAKLYLAAYALRDKHQWDAALQNMQKAYWAAVKAGHKAFADLARKDTVRFLSRTAVPPKLEAVVKALKAALAPEDQGRLIDMLLLLGKVYHRCGNDRGTVAALMAHHAQPGLLPTQQAEGALILFDANTALGRYKLAVTAAGFVARLARKKKLDPKSAAVLSAENSLKMSATQLRNAALQTKHPGNIEAAMLAYAYYGMLPHPKNKLEVPFLMGRQAADLGLLWGRILLKKVAFWKNQVQPPPPAPAPRGGRVKTTGAPSVYGTISAATIRRVVRRNLAGVKRCYVLALLQKPTLAGAVTLRMVINTEGRVTQASVDKDSLGNPAVGQCIVKLAKDWRFSPVHNPGLTVHVSYPLVLKPRQ